MKHLYYLEFANLFKKDGNIAPAKSLKWFIPNHIKTAYEDRRVCEQERLLYMKNALIYIPRVKKASFFKTLAIRFNRNNWIINNE